MGAPKLFAIAAIANMITAPTIGAIFHLPPRGSRWRHG
jgi:hypothetical protein